VDRMDANYKEIKTDSEDAGTCTRDKTSTTHSLTERNCLHYNLAYCSTIYTKSRSLSTLIAYLPTTRWPSLSSLTNDPLLSPPLSFRAE